MKRVIAVLICFNFITSYIFAQRDTCNIGVYVSSLHDFDFSKKSFSADFWIWMNYKNDTLNFENVLDVTNSKTDEFKHFFHEKKNGNNLVTEKCEAELMCDWDVSRFPFDKQTVYIYIEDADHGTSGLVYKADKLDSTIDSANNSGEWLLSVLRSMTVYIPMRKPLATKFFMLKRLPFDISSDKVETQ